MAAAKIDISTIYTDHYEKLRLSLSKVSNDSLIIEDVVQDAFIKLHLHLKRGKPIDNPQGWLYRVSKNLLIDHFRKEKHTDVLDDEGISEKPKTENGHGPEDCLLGIIANLPYKYKKAVYLTDVKGIPQTESALTLNLSLPTFKSHVQRGRKLVAQGYVECCDYTLDQNGHLQGQSKDWQDCKVCSKG